MREASRMKDHWTQYIPAIVLYPVAAIIAILGLVLIPTAVINNTNWMRNTHYVIAELFSE